MGKMPLNSLGISWAPKDIYSLLVHYLLRTHGGSPLFLVSENFLGNKCNLLFIFLLFCTSLFHIFCIWVDKNSLKKGRDGQSGFLLVNFLLFCISHSPFLYFLTLSNKSNLVQMRVDEPRWSEMPSWILILFPVIADNPVDQQSIFLNTTQLNNRSF